MSDFRPGFLNTPRTGGVREPTRRRNFLARFWQEEIVNPQHAEGNMSIAWGTAVFAAGILFAKTIAKDTIVPVL